MKKIRKEINDNLPQVDKFLSDTGETIRKTLDNFLKDVVKGAEKLFESPFKDKEKKNKS